MKKAKMKRVAHCVTVSKELLDDFKEKYNFHPFRKGTKSKNIYSLNELIHLALREVFFTPPYNSFDYYSLMQYIQNRPRLIKNESGLPEEYVVALSTGSYDEKTKITVRLNPGFNEKCQEFIDMNEWRGFSHMVTLAMINARGAE